MDVQSPDQLADQLAVTAAQLRGCIQRLTILDIVVDAVDLDGALAFVDRCVREARCPCCVLASNPEKMYSLRRDARLNAFFCSAALLLPDGMGLVVGARILYGRRLPRLAGADLMQHICAVAPDRGYRIFVYGASEDVNRRAVAELRRRYPGIAIVGRANGYIKPEQNPGLIRSINDSGADILFVALGSPRQERWLEENLHQLNVKICQGIGGTLDTVAGSVKRAPRVWRALGIEWLYRLVRQPYRYPRYIIIPKFLTEVVRARILGRAQTAV